MSVCQSQNIRLTCPPPSLRAYQEPPALSAGKGAKCDLRGSRNQLKATQLQWLTPPELTALLTADTSAMARKAGPKPCALGMLNSVACCSFGGTVLAVAAKLFLVCQKARKIITKFSKLPVLKQLALLDELVCQIFHWKPRNAFKRTSEVSKD